MFVRQLPLHKSRRGGKRLRPADMPWANQSRQAVDVAMQSRNQRWICFHSPPCRCLGRNRFD